MLREPDARRPRFAVGMRDIAERLGVSVGTVDRALHDKPGIKPDTRARVLATAETLGYRPNLAARYLRSRKPLRISVCLPARASVFWQTLQDGIREAAVQFAPSLALDFRAYGPADEQALLRPGRPLAGNADGLIIAPGCSDTLERRLEEVARRNIPVACVVDAVPDSSRLLSIFADPFSVGALAGELIGRFLPGGGQVAVVASSVSTRPHAEQMRGFVSSLSKLSARLKLSAVVEWHVDERESHRRIRQLLHAHPRLKGLYISASEALPVLRAVGHEGRLADLAVVAADLYPELFPWIQSGKVAATIYQRPLTQGHLALQLLYQHLRTGVMPAPHRQAIAPFAVMSSNLHILRQRLDIARAASLSHENAARPAQSPSPLRD